MKTSFRIKAKPFYAHIPWWISSSLGLFFSYCIIFELDRFHFGAAHSNQLISLFDTMIHHDLTSYCAWFFVSIIFLFSFFGYVHHASAHHLLENTKTLQALRQLSWQDFERMVGQVYSKHGWRVEETGLGGADGGVDLLLRSGAQKIIVQCKHYKTTAVGAPVVREMYGLMMHHNATGVKIVCIGRFTKAAHAFAVGKPIDLVDGESLVELVSAAPR